LPQAGKQKLLYFSEKKHAVTVVTVSQEKIEKRARRKLHANFIYNTFKKKKKKNTKTKPSPMLMTNKNERNGS
jgi:hypothetical protein